MSGSSALQTWPMLGRALIELSLDDARWQALVDSDPNALPFHTPAWTKMLAECYGFRAWGLALERPDRTLAAGLPLIETRRPLARARRWTSLPFTDYCPPARAADADAEDVARLLELADDARRSEDVERLELRSAAQQGSVECIGYRHVLELDADPEVVRRRFHKTKKQSKGQLEKAERSGSLVIRRAACADDVSGVFYRLHASTRRRLGVPVQPRRFFDLLWERMLEPGNGWVLLAYAGDEAVAGAVFLTSARTVVYKFGASEQRWQRLRPNNLLFWHAIRESCERGFDDFDFGRTDFWNPGLREFKRQWGTAEHELTYTRIGEGWPSAKSSPGLSSRLLGPVLRRAPIVVSRATGELLYRYAA